MHPFCSIIIRTKNNRETLLASVQSALDQTISPEAYQLIIVDDHSEDNSLQTISQLQENFTAVTTTGVGAVAALNLGLAEVHTPYFTVLDGDDTLPHTALAEYQSALDHTPTAAAVYGNYTEVSVSGTATSISTKENIFTTIAGGICFHTQAVREVGGYDASLFFPEYDLLLKLREKKILVHIPKEVYSYHRHHGSLTADTQKVAAGIRQLEEKYQRSLPIRKY